MSVAVSSAFVRPADIDGDIVDLEDLDHAVKEFCGRRLRARRAQKILQDFHGVPR